MGAQVTKGKGAVTGGEVVVYEEKGGRVRLEVRLEGETVWLSLTQMAALFGRDKSVTDEGRAVLDVVAPSTKSQR